MGLAAGVVGVVIFLRKESLLGESLSHAAFPGAILGAFVGGLLGSDEDLSSLIILAGAAFTAYLSIFFIRWLVTRLRIHSDAALCFTLAATFGIGVTLASHMQFSDPALYRNMLALLYGQAATMTDFHVYLYGALAAVVILLAALFRKEIQITSFDRTYASSLMLPVKIIEAVFFALAVLAVIIGIRSVGVVLMSAMLIAPPAAARQFSNRFTTLLFLSGIFGILSGYLGNILSVTGSQELSLLFPNTRLSLPTGPVIVTISALLCFGALLFAPERGLASRAWRIARFRYKCLRENILKCIWRHTKDYSTTIPLLQEHLNATSLTLLIALHHLKQEGWLEKNGKGSWKLTSDGIVKAAKIVRLHRLWEVYLADYLGIGAERVHRSAEEMEHIITPELEASLTRLLKDPKVDPHKQPIPAADTGKTL
jgi:manganese/zinc/iron transport system permease protein